MNDNKRDTNNQRENAEGQDTKIYLTDDSTLQTREEKDRDDKVDPREDRTISVSEDDLHDAKAGRLTGRDEETDETGSENE